MHKENILLGVCGSVAAYRSVDMARRWSTQGYDVKVVLTKGAERFVMPSLFSYLGVEAYGHRDDLSSKGILHMDLSRWCDRLVIAPLSANTLAKLAHGFSDDLLSSLFLALGRDCPVIVFPAMNTRMLKNPVVAENMEKLKRNLSVFIQPSGEGKLACGDTGEGKLPEVEQIVEVAPLVNLNCGKKEKILIATGATLSPLDEVRHLTNSSSGLTGYYLAKEALFQGYEVRLIAGLHAIDQIDFLDRLEGCRVFRVATTKDAFEVALKEIEEAIVYMSPAAWSDIEFQTRPGKIKKEEMGSSLSIGQSVDVLGELIKKRKEHQKFIGFAAEKELKSEILREKWERKPVDLLVGTQVDNGLLDGVRRGFREEEGEYAFIQNGEIIFCRNMSKQKLAEEIFRIMGL